MASLVLTAGTLVTTPSAGQQEFSGTIFTGAPTATTRGIIPTEQFYRIDTPVVGTQVTTAQSTFGVGVTLASNTVYEFEYAFALSKTAGTTAHTISYGYGGTAILNGIMDLRYIMNNSAGNSIAGSGQPLQYVGSVGATAATTSITSAVWVAYAGIKGTVSINTGGTFIPQYTLSGAPGGAYTTVFGSYMKIKPIGVTNVNTSVGTWA